MKSAGNDIVALKLIDKQRTIQPAFYSKFITNTELALYQEQHFAFEIFVWTLWSVKESAYKYVKKSKADLLFSPSKIIVQSIEHSTKSETVLDSDQSVDKFFKGEVLIDAQNIYFQSGISNEFIATIVSDEGSFKDVYWGVKQIEKTDSASQSKAVRGFLLNRLICEFRNGNLTIEKSPVGYPVLLNDGKLTNIPISFAHHDRYVSYSFLNAK